jgi:integrase
VKCISGSSFPRVEPRGRRAARDWAEAAFCWRSLDISAAKHTFRRYVSLMHAAGCSLEEIGDYVGHSSAYMTDRYRPLLDGEREQGRPAAGRALPKASI